MGDLKPSEDIAQRLNRVRVAWPVNRSLSSHEQDQALYAIIAYLDERHEATAGLPQAPADGGEVMSTNDLRVFHLTGELRAVSKEATEHAEARAELQEQVAALTAERDRLQGVILGMRGGLPFRDAEMRREGWREASAVVEAAKGFLAARGAGAIGALTDLERALDALTQPTAGPTD